MQRSKNGEQEISFLLMMLDDLKSKLRKEGAITISVIVKPDARITQVSGILDDGTVVIDVAESAQKGRANRGLIRFLSSKFCVPQANVEIIGGNVSRRKRIRIKT